MKRKEAIRMAMSARAEAYLRMRYLALRLEHTVDDDNAPDLATVAVEPIPDAVGRVLDSVCLGCLNDAITQGDWGAIDQFLIGDCTALEAQFIH